MKLALTIIAFVLLLVRLGSVRSECDYGNVACGIDWGGGMYTEPDNPFDSGEDS